jgi:hypothetical protein
MKKTLAAAVLFPMFTSAAMADVHQVDEATIVKAVGSPVLKRSQEEDSSGCKVSGYTFGDKTFSMKLEFKCDRINVGWTTAPEPEYEAKSKQATALAKQAVASLTGADGVEVERVLAGGRYEGRTFPNGISVSGLCIVDSCLLTFR